MFLCLNSFSQVTSEIPKFKNEKLPKNLAWGGAVCLIVPYSILIYKQDYGMYNKKESDIFTGFMFSGLTMVSVSISIAGRRERIKRQYSDYLIEKQIRKYGL